MYRKDHDLRSKNLESDRKRNRAGRDAPGPKDMAGLLKNCGIDLSRRQVDQLWTYHQLLREYNEELNLTRIHNFANMVLKLYVDSILPGAMIDLPSPLLDLGTGPGMPGIPLKIAYPHVEMLLAEGRGKRVDFLRIAVERLGLDGVGVIDRAITPSFEQPVAGVITRAVETIAQTLDHIRGCLASGGPAIFMKGPNCDEEVRAAAAGESKYRESYRLVRDESYRIPNTSHERRLVVFQRLDRPVWAVKADIMKRHVTRTIESDQNDLFKDLKKLLTARGVRKLGKTLIFGQRQASEILRDFPEKCRAWVGRGDESPPPEDAPEHLAWYRLAPPLFEQIDVFGTHSPFLLADLPDIEAWEPSSGLPEGCALLIPFQDPENVGAVVRSAAAFGVKRIILLAESAHPFHPKALRASGANAFRVEFLQGPALASLPENLPLLPLSAEGADLARADFPESFGFLPGMEGPGLPEAWRKRAVSIPIAPGVESLNAATAAAIAMYVWSRSKGGST